MKAISHQPSTICRKPLMSSPRRRGGSRATQTTAPRAFTLTELMIAVVVLIIVILAASRIFATASQVTGIGQSTADVMTEAAAIERQIRKDIEKMSREGVFAIRNVRVRNDVNGAALLDPDLPVDAGIRCDQLVFFANGIEGSQIPHMTDGRNSKGQATESLVYYGHAFQIPDGGPFDADSVSVGYAQDPAANETIYPWSSGQVNMARTKFSSVQNTNGQDIFGKTGDGSLIINQPGARQWLLARQTAFLADDDQSAPNENGKTVFLGQVTTARSVFFNNPSFSDPAPGWPAFTSTQLRDGRVDGAATGLDDIRRIIQSRGDWQDQRSYIVNNLAVYPRAERIAPSSHRIDQALTNPVLASGCSSFIVEWTYDLGVGEAGELAGVSNIGITGLGGYEPGGEIRWFGMEDPARGVYPYSSPDWPDGWTGRAGRYFLAGGSSSTEPAPSRTYTIFPANIETFEEPNPSVNVVNYVFGFNQDKAFINPVTDLPDASVGDTDPSVGYTPWPSALRITMTLHDPEGKLEGGRTVQFIVRLPEQE